MSKIVWSEYQKAIFEEVKSGTGHCIINARAGSAKTSSLLESLKYIPSNKKTLVVAFNKKIADELKLKCNYPHIEISTLHSFGFKIVKKSISNIKLDTDKSFKVIKNILNGLKSNSKERDDFDTIFEIRKCVSLCKNTFTSSSTKIDDLMDDFDISSGSLEREVFISTVIKVLDECKKDQKSIDFDDMIYFPLALNLPIDKYDVVMIDESQDASISQINLSLLACKEGGRVISFGDSEQVLYSFLGIELDSLSNLQKKLNARQLSLPISYRCAKSIIFKAQRLVPDITYAPNAIDGKVVNIVEDELLKLIQKGDFIISRTNAALVKWCLKLWKNKIPASIKGKDLAPMLNGIIKQSKKKNIKSFLTWLDIWETNELSRLKAKNKDTKLVSDKVECLKILSENKNTVNELLDTIKSLLDNKNEGNVVSLFTIHGSKGLESNRVFFLTSTMVFGNGKEEKNCEYVAMTRAKSELYLVSKSQK